MEVDDPWEAGVSVAQDSQRPPPCTRIRTDRREVGEEFEEFEEFKEFKKFKEFWSRGARTLYRSRAPSGEGQRAPTRCPAIRVLRAGAGKWPYRAIPGNPALPGGAGRWHCGQREGSRRTGWLPSAGINRPPDSARIRPEFTAVHCSAIGDTIGVVAVEGRERRNWPRWGKG